MNSPGSNRFVPDTVKKKLAKFHQGRGPVVLGVQVNVEPHPATKKTLQLNKPGNLAEGELKIPY